MSAASLKPKAKALAKRHGLMAQEAMQIELMRNTIWRNYAKDNLYAADICFDSAIDAAVEVGERMRS